MRGNKIRGEMKEKNVELSDLGRFLFDGYFVGTSRFSSSTQCWTTTMLAAASREMRRDDGGREERGRLGGDRGWGEGG